MVFHSYGPPMEMVIAMRWRFLSQLMLKERDKDVVPHKGMSFATQMNSIISIRPDRPILVAKVSVAVVEGILEEEANKRWP